MTRLDKTAQRDHLAFVIADVDAIDVVYARPVGGLGLDLNLPGAAEEVHVVDIIAAKRRLQCLEDGAQRHPEDLRLVAVDIEIDGRVGRREGAEDAVELWILVRSDKQATQHLRQRLRIAALQVLQNVSEAAARAEADDRRRRKGHDSAPLNLSELRV